MAPAPGNNGQWERSFAGAKRRKAVGAFDALKRKRRTRKILRNLPKRVWSAWIVGRKKDPELYTPNNFFKLKYGNQRILALAYPKTRDELRSLVRDLQKAV